MARGQKIHLQVQQVVVWLLSHFKKEDIAVYTGVSERAVERILRYHNEHVS
jgi:hypothetical protein